MTGRARKLALTQKTNKMIYKRLLQVLVIIVVILITLDTFVTKEIEQNYTTSIKQEKQKVDSLKIVIEKRDTIIKWKRRKIKYIYRTRLHRDTVKKIVIKHQKEYFGRDTLPSCDTLLVHHAKTILHLENVQEQNVLLDSSLTDCKTALNSLENVDSLRLEQIKDLNKAHKRKKWNNRLKAVLVGIGVGFFIAQ